MTATTTLAGTAAAQVTQQATCPILNLVIAPIHLDLLGLVVDLPNPLVINIVAESGAGNLLGICCARSPVCSMAAAQFSSSSPRSIT